MKIIDISIHNQLKDYDGAEYDGVMIRTGYRTHIDEEFVRKALEYHIQRSIPYGFYYYSYAKPGNENETEINAQLNFIDKMSLEYGKPLLPVVVDIEDADGKRSTFAAMDNKNVIIEACESIEKRGYYAMFYTNEWYLRNKISDYIGLTKRFDLWIAKWSSTQPSESYGMWQFTNNYEGRHLDCSFTQRDYPSMILSKVYGDCVEDNAVKVGDSVKIIIGIDYYGTKLSRFMLQNVYTVSEIIGNRAVLIDYRGVVMCAIELEKLSVVNPVK